MRPIQSSRRRRHDVDSGRNGADSCIAVHARRASRPGSPPIPRARSRDARCTAVEWLDGPVVRSPRSSSTWHVRPAELRATVTLAGSKLVRVRRARALGPEWLSLRAPAVVRSRRSTRVGRLVIDGTSSSLELIAGIVARRHPAAAPSMPGALRSRDGARRRRRGCRLHHGRHRPPRTRSTQIVGTSQVHARVLAAGRGHARHVVRGATIARRRLMVVLRIATDEHPSGLDTASGSGSRSAMNPACSPSSTSCNLSTEVQGGFDRTEAHFAASGSATKSKCEPMRRYRPCGFTLLSAVERCLVAPCCRCGRWCARPCRGSWR